MCQGKGVSWAQATERAEQLGAINAKFIKHHISQWSEYQVAIWTFGKMALFVDFKNGIFWGSKLGLFG
jgi:hypothetical protein